MSAVMMEMESIATSPSCTATITNSVALSQGHGPQPAEGSPRICLCLWTALVILWVLGFLLIALRNGSMRITSKEFVCGIFTITVKTQDSQSPTVVSSLLLSNRQKALSKCQLVNTLMDRLAAGSSTLRNRASVASKAHPVLYTRSVWKKSRHY